jgi:H+/Cl- antiporter ClcA
MEDLLGFILELLFEVLLQLIFEGGVAAASRAPRRFRFGPFLRIALSPRNPILTTLLFCLLGIGLGALSVTFFSHPLVHPSRFHGISLLISPVITGLIMGLIGRSVRRRGNTPVRIESFAYGFTFALAFMLVRFFVVQ